MWKESVECFTKTWYRKNVVRIWRRTTLIREKFREEEMKDNPWEINSIQLRGMAF